MRQHARFFLWPHTLVALLAVFPACDGEGPAQPKQTPQLASRDTPAHPRAAAGEPSEVVLKSQPPLPLALPPPEPRSPKAPDDSPPPDGSQKPVPAPENPNTPPPDNDPLPASPSDAEDTDSASTTSDGPRTPDTQVTQGNPNANEDTDSPDVSRAKLRTKALKDKFKTKMTSALRSAQKGAPRSEALQPKFTLRAGPSGELRQLTFAALPVTYRKQELLFDSHPEKPSIFKEVKPREGEAEVRVRIKFFAVSNQGDEVDCTLEVVADGEYQRLFLPAHNDPAVGQAVELGPVNCLDVRPQKRKKK